MKVLLVAATKAEIEPLISLYGSPDTPVALANNELTIMISGVGMVATAYALGRQLASEKYELAINAGIAGSFDRSIEIGEVVLITEDHFSEIGAENNEEFLSIDKIGFGESRIIPVSPVRENMAISKLKQVKSVTVNTAHGNADSIQALVKRLDPQTESMEGAAFFYACNQVNLPCLQIRAISNYVEPRNPENWDIGLAVKNLNSCLIELFNQL